MASSLRCGSGQRDDIRRLRRRHVEPLFRLVFRRESLVMAVNHGGRVARLRCGQVLVGV